MSRSTVTALRSVVTALSLAVGAIVVPVVAATAAAADPAPVAQKSAEVVTTDALPTVQVNGVVWAQVIVGNTVYVGGSFTTATAAVSDPVQGSWTRNNLLAYDLTTGRLIESFNVSLNGQVISLATSPDKTKLYVGGDFTHADGIAHRRLLAINTANNQVIQGFSPTLDARVAAIVATDTTVYVGGNLSSANGVARQRLAAFSTAGALLNWAPTADQAVKAMVMTPDASKIVVGGQLQMLNGIDVYGLGALSPVDGSVLPYGVTNVIRAFGPTSAVTSLRTDGTNVYGTGYTFGPLPIFGSREFEGTFAAEANSGNLVWLEDCHGDSYDVYATAETVYSVSHAHYCVGMGAFPQTVVGDNRRALAFTKAVTGTLANNTASGYKNWVGTPSPTMLNWFPDLEVGTFTGQSQAAWTVTGSGPYVVMGGEFPIVNGQPQSGLVRFAVKPVAPGLDGPRVSGSNFVASAVSLRSGQVRLRFQTNWDRDDQDLTYKLIRNKVTAQPIYTATLTSQWWNRPYVDFVDTGLTPGSTVNYRLIVTDPDGNQVQGDLVTVQVADAGSQYLQAVVAASPSLLYRLDEPNGITVFDYNETNNATASAGVTRGAAGAIVGDPDSASTFSGTTTGLAASGSASVTATDSYTLEGWVRTTSTTGGAILNFGNRVSGNSPAVDRLLYMDNTGRILFGSNNGGLRTVASTATYRDGVWHHVAATLSPSGMNLYVDGVRVGTRADVTTGSTLTGYWRIGGDTLSGWTSRPTSSYLAGELDEVAVYPTALSASTIAQHATLGGKTVTGPVAPADAYGSTVFASTPEFFWRLGEASGTALTDSGPFGVTPGTYSGVVTLGQTGALVGNTDKAAKFNGSNGFAYSNNGAAGPSTVSVEAWVSTTTTAGGRIVGFGNSKTGNSTSYDRQLYMTNAGKLAFKVGSVVLTSPLSYNNGVYHHVVGVNGGGVLALYVDGAVVASQAATAPLSITTGFWRVGGDTTGGSTSRFLNGTIDEVAVYYSALDAASVLWHYQVGTDTTPNTAPVASFISSAVDLAVAFDGSASTDPDGSIAGYSWNFGDGTTGTGATASHTFPATGSYTVTLTVTDNRGATNTVTQSVSVLAANMLPTAAFTATVTDATVAADASTSADADGTIVSYAWNWGDGSPDGSGVTESHTYTVTGSYTVTLTTTDDRGGVSTTTQTVAVAAPNNPPTAAFTGLASLRVVSVDGSGSTDVDGTVASYSWNWGDGSADSVGATSNHSYAVDGTYAVTLTVTDNVGATATVTQNLTVSSVVAADAFARTLVSSWGSADVGGAWTLSGGASKFSTTGSLGQILLSAAGSGPTAALNSVALRDLNGTVDVSVDKMATGGGTYGTVFVRRVGTSNYQFTMKFLATGAVSVSITRVDNGVSATLGTATVAGLTYVAGDVIRFRFQAVGSGTTTLSASAWKVGSTEPAVAALTRTDTTASLQVAGALSLQGYLSASSTNAPVVTSFDNLTVSVP